MGCDIHMYLEVRDSDGKWRYEYEIDLSRYYSAFTVLGGVRGYCDKPITGRLQLD